MPKRIPKYVRHKARNKGKVTINGKTHYLPGDYDSDQSRAEYERLIAEYLAKPKTPQTANVTIRFLAVADMKFCAVFYVNEDGKPSEEISQVRRSLKPLLKLFGSEQTSRFGPRKLKQVREAMISSGLYRNTINDRVSRIVRMLSWAAEEEYLNPHIVVACREVRNLQEGRCGNVPDAANDLSSKPLIGNPLASSCRLHALSKLVTLCPGAIHGSEEMQMRARWPVAVSKNGLTQM